MKQLRQQQGFTMIELIMVIVILGVLSAFALPRFADLGGSARTAAIEGLGGSMKSAVGISRAAYLANGGSGTTVDLDGVTVAMTSGYPDATDSTTPANIDVTGIIAAAGLADNDGTDAANYVDGDYTYIVTAANEIVIGVTSVMDADGSGAVSAAEAGAAGAGRCRVTYDATAPASVVVETDDC